MSDFAFNQMMNNVDLLSYLERIQLLQRISESLKIFQQVEKTSEVTKKEKVENLIDKYAGSCEGLWTEDALEYQNKMREDREIG